MLTVEDRCDAYEAGHNAQKAGQPDSANPHPKPDETFSLAWYWLDGWRNATHPNGTDPAWFRRAMRD